MTSIHPSLSRSTAWTSHRRSSSNSSPYSLSRHAKGLVPLLLVVFPRRRSSSNSLTRCQGTQTASPSPTRSPRSPPMLEGTSVIRADREEFEDAVSEGPSSACCGSRLLYVSVQPLPVRYHSILGLSSRCLHTVDWENALGGGDPFDEYIVMYCVESRREYIRLCSTCARSPRRALRVRNCPIAPKAPLYAL